MPHASPPSPKPSALLKGTGRSAAEDSAAPAPRWPATLLSHRFLQWLVDRVNGELAKHAEASQGLLFQDCAPRFLRAGGGKAVNRTLMPDGGSGPGWRGWWVHARPCLFSGGAVGTGAALCTEEQVRVLGGAAGCWLLRLQQLRARCGSSTAMRRCQPATGLRGAAVLQEQ